MKTTNKAAWILFISRRFARVDTGGRNAAAAILSSLGIAFGVMTLIVVIAVMNGFQTGKIESILEIQSFHLRAYPQNAEQQIVLESELQKNPLVRTFIPFMEAQALSVGKNGRQAAAFIRFVPEDIRKTDEGFRKEITMYEGRFDLSDNQAVLGITLARALRVHPGDTVNLLAMSGSSDVDLLSADRVFTVAGIFSCEHAEINEGFMFFSLDTGKKLLGQSAPTVYGIKLHKTSQDGRVLKYLEDKTSVPVESWRTYNKSFFGALKVEKNVLMLLVFIIFIVVGVNIFNGMRRMIFERREEIAVLSALGSPPFFIQTVFLMQGLLIGLSGAIPGLLFGMLISVRMDAVFLIISKAVYYVQYFFTLLFNPAALMYVSENPMFMFYAQIPARMFFGETALITIFGILSALTASYFASKNILKLSIAEVLRYE